MLAVPSWQGWEEVDDVSMVNRGMAAAHQYACVGVSGPPTLLAKTALGASPASSVLCWQFHHARAGRK